MNQILTFRDALTFEEVLERFKEAGKVKTNERTKKKGVNLQIRTMSMEDLERKITTVRKDRMNMHL